MPLTFANWRRGGRSLTPAEETEERAATVASVDGSDFRTALADHIGELTNLYVGSSERKTTFTAAKRPPMRSRECGGCRRAKPTRPLYRPAFMRLTQSLGGLRRGEYILLAGRPSMGKSALALQIAANVAEQGYGVGYFSLEMPAPLLMPRLLIAQALDARIRLSLLCRNASRCVNDDDLRWAEGVATELKGWALTIDDEPGLTAPEIEARARVMASRSRPSGKQLGLVVVDHIHKMHAPGPYSKAAEFSEVERDARGGGQAS